MPFRYDINVDAGLGVVTFVGAIDGEDLVGAIAALFSDGRWTSGYSAVWDFRDVEQFVIEPSDVAAVLETVADLHDERQTGKAAFVARRHLDLSILNMFSFRLKRIPGREANVFDDLGKAAAWLDANRQLCPLIAQLQESDAR